MAPPAAPFTVTRDTTLPPSQAWSRITDWPQHGRFIPFTSVVVDTPDPFGVGSVFTGWTGVGRVRFADPMEAVVWDPPGEGDDPRSGLCRLQKRGRVVLGWAELRVDPHDDGSRVSWREVAAPKGLPRFAEPVSDLAGRVLFARVLRGLLAT